MVAPQMLMRSTSALRKAVASDAVLVPLVAWIWPLASTVTLLPYEMLAPAGQSRFAPWTVRVAIVCEVLSGPRFTVSRPIDDTVPSWLVVTAITAPAPAAPAVALVTTTLAPDCAAL